MSSAGPAVPVMKTQNDSVPNGWMARLEAARVTAAQSLATEGAEAKPVPPPPPPNKPPPLEKKKKKKKEELTRKPAHLLVAQLQEDEAKRREAETKQLDQLFQRENPDAISSMEIAVPTDLKKKKRIPDWVVVTLLATVVIGGIYGAYQMVQKEPAPVVKVDAKLVEEAEKRKQSVAALEQGHLFVQQGKPDKAIPAYQKALVADPTFAAAERGLAIAYTKKDDDATAVAHYKRYLELDPAAKDAEDVKKIITAYEKKVEKDRIAAERAAKLAAKQAAEKAAIQAAQKAQAEKIRRARQPKPKVMDEQTRELEKLTDDLINE